MAGGPGRTEASSLGSLTRVRLTNTGKVLYPAAGITKADVLMYYIRAAPRMLPFLHDRPLTMHRFPEGVDGEGFFEKDAPRGTPDYVEIFTRYSETADREVHFVLCNNLDTLIWIANLASLEIHTTLSTTAAYESPDLLLFDIDPEPPLGFDDVIDVALVVREELEAAGLRPFVKTSGKKGVHIVVPLVPGYRFAAVRDFAHDIGKKIARTTPPRRLGVPPVPGPGDDLHRLPPERPREDDGRPVQPPGHPRRHGLRPAPVGGTPARSPSRRF